MNIESINEINKLNNKLKKVHKELHIIGCNALFELSEPDISKLDQLETSKIELEKKINYFKNIIEKNKKNLRDMINTYDMQEGMYKNQPLTKENYELFYENYKTKEAFLKSYLDTKKIGNEIYLLNII